MLRLPAATAAAQRNSKDDNGGTQAQAQQTKGSKRKVCLTKGGLCKVPEVIGQSLPQLLSFSVIADMTIRAILNFELLNSKRR